MAAPRYISSFAAPTEYERQAAEARRRQALAEALEAQAYQPLSGSAAPTPSAAPLVMALQSFLSARQRRKAEEAGEQATQMEQEFGRRIAGRLEGGYTPPSKEEAARVFDKGQRTPEQIMAAMPAETTLQEVTPTAQYRKAPQEALSMAMTPLGMGAMKRAPLLAAALEKSMETPTAEEFGTTIVRTKDGKSVIVGKRGTVKEVDVTLPEEKPQTGMTDYQREMLRLKELEIRSRAAGAGRGGKALSPTMQKEIFQTDENILATETGIDLLKQARTLSDKSFEGFGAGERAQAATLLPDAIEPAGAKETLEFDLLLKQQVLPQLRAIFGAAPTEGERAILLELQGSSSLPTKTRNAILDRALKSAEQRLQFNRQKSSQLREGTYFSSPPEQLPDGFELE